VDKKNGKSKEETLKPLSTFPPWRCMEKCITPYT